MNYIYRHNLTNSFKINFYEMKIYFIKIHNVNKMPPTKTFFLSGEYTSIIWKQSFLVQVA